MNFELWGEAIRDYAKWIGKQSPVAAKEWRDRLNDEDHESNQEGALGEACTWAYLRTRVSTICLCDSRKEKRPDFRCAAKNGSEFIVETTNLTRKNVTEHTGLADKVADNPEYLKFSPFTKMILNKAKSKASQLSSLDVPALLFVTTFHSQASSSCIKTPLMTFLLVGTPEITWKINPATGEAVSEPYESSRQRDSVFSTIRAEDELGGCPLMPLRQSVSGLVVAGFGLGLSRHRVIGVLHPDAVRPFDVQCLPEVRFGRLAAWPPENRILEVVWTRADGSPCDDESERRKSAREAGARLRRDGHGDWLEEFERGAAQDSS